MGGRAAVPKGTQSCRTQGTFIHSFVRSFIRLFVRPFVCPPQALSGLKSALSGLKSAFSGLKSALSGLESALSGLKSALLDLKSVLSGVGKGHQHSVTNFAEFQAIIASRPLPNCLRLSCVSGLVCI